jgi:hypothetical protein
MYCISLYKVYMRDKTIEETTRRNYWNIFSSSLISESKHDIITLTYDSSLLSGIYCLKMTYILDSSIKMKPLSCSHVHTFFRLSEFTMKVTNCISLDEIHALQDKFKIELSSKYVSCFTCITFKKKKKAI